MVYNDFIKDDFIPEGDEQVFEILEGRVRQPSPSIVKKTPERFLQKQRHLAVAAVR